MSFRSVISLFAISCVLVSPPRSSFAQEQTGPQRKVVSQVSPEYPSLARTMNISGTVKIEVLVNPKGTVKSVEIKGGHPVLAQAAVGAVTRWIWEPTPHETNESVELRFNSQ